MRFTAPVVPRTLSIHGMVIVLSKYPMLAVLLKVFLCLKLLVLFKVPLLLIMAAFFKVLNITSISQGTNIPMEPLLHKVPIPSDTSLS